MSNVLIFVEQSHGALRKASLPAITFGQQMAAKTGGALHLVLIGQDVSAAAEQARGFGAAKVYTIAHAGYTHYLCETYTHALAQAAQACGASVIGAAASSCSKDMLPRLSARMGAAMASDVLQVVDANTFKRPMWAGNVVATVQLTTPTKVCTVRTTEFAAPASGAASTVQALDVAPNVDGARARFVSAKEVQSERPDVTTASRVVAGGRGVKGAEGFKIIEQLADKLGAGIGASRAVCDAGWVPNDLQIGQTGKVVAPNLYLAVGISGAIQHLAGMKGSKVIVAINKDPEAPIFQVADYGLVADLFAAVPELVKAL
jgi:electron transfer flavoprotein alpha subunit